MKYKELKQKSPTELKKLLTESRDKLRDLRFKVATKQVKNVREIRRVKQQIARILTLLKRKENEKPKTRNYKMDGTAER
jgi:large subunit ribosomal protein L29